jgi:hypothetical protein
VTQGSTRTDSWSKSHHVTHDVGRQVNIDPARYGEVDDYWDIGRV